MFLHSLYIWPWALLIAIIIIIKYYTLIQKRKKEETVNQQDIKNNVQPIKYDDATRHSDCFLDEENTKDLDIFQWCVHIWFFIGWCIENNLLSQQREETIRNEIKQFLKWEISWPVLLENYLDGKLVSYMLNNEWNAFATYYYWDTMWYIEDIQECFKDLPTTYHIQDTKANYEKVKTIISQRFTTWRKRNEK